MARCASDPCTRWRPGVMTGVSGVTIDQRWFCSHGCVERMVQRVIAGAVPETPVAVTSAPRLRLGVLLRHQGALSADQLHEALEQQRKSGLRLGAQARAMYGIDAAQVLRALAAQAGTRYLTAIDPATVHDAPGRLSRTAIKALGLIPFSHPDKYGHVRVASTAPLRWDAVSALRRLADWEPEPYLVEDDTWNELYEQYGAAARTDSGTQARSEAVLAKTPQEAAARIAAVVSSTRRARLAEAYWDPYIWVRVQGDAVIEDVLIARTSGEGTWQAANTSR